MFSRKVVNCLVIVFLCAGNALAANTVISGKTIQVDGSGATKEVSSFWKSPTDVFTHYKQNICKRRQIDIVEKVLNEDGSHDNRVDGYYATVNLYSELASVRHFNSVEINDDVMNSEVHSPYMRGDKAIIGFTVSPILYVDGFCQLADEKAVRSYLSSGIDAQ